MDYANLTFLFSAIAGILFIMAIIAMGNGRPKRQWLSLFILAIILCALTVLLSSFGHPHIVIPRP